MQRHPPGHSPTFRLRATGFVLLVAHLLVVGWLVTRPVNGDWVPAANLHPLATIRAELAEGPREAVRTLGPPMLLLAPLGALLPMVAGRPGRCRLGSFAHTLFTGAMVSLVIELVQTNVSGRTLDVDVMLLNTAGVGVAYVLLAPVVSALRRLGARRRRRGGTGASGPDGSQGATPTLPRVGMAP